MMWVTTVREDTEEAERFYEATHEFDFPNMDPDEMFSADSPVALS